MELINLRQTGRVSPSQWEARTIDHRPVYIRYRWGYLSINVGPMDGSIDDALTIEELYGAQLGGKYDGEIAWEKVKPIVDALPEL
jgi:hypothetical protein